MGKEGRGEGEGRGEEEKEWEDREFEEVDGRWPRRLDLKKKYIFINANYMAVVT